MLLPERHQLLLLLVALLAGAGTVFVLEQGRQYSAHSVAPHSTLVERDLRIRKLHSLRPFISSIYRELIPPDAPVALVSLPNHWNLGDSLIWHGENDVLDTLGLRLAYMCLDSRCNTPRELRRLADEIQNGTILVHGGGNYGDLYPKYNNYVSTLVHRFPRNRIILLPQSVFFLNSSNMIRDVSLHFGHPEFFLLVRDLSSFDTVSSALQTTKPLQWGDRKKLPRLRLCPDSAFAIGPQKTFCKPDVDVVFLSRRDDEKVMSNRVAQAQMTSSNVSFVVLDWMTQSDSKKIVPTLEHTPLGLSELPRFRLLVAKEILCRGRVVITDRLHAAVLSILMGRPVVALDNLYGKITSVLRFTLSNAGVGAPLALENAGAVLATDENTAVFEVIKFLQRRIDVDSPIPL